MESRSRPTGSTSRASAVVSVVRTVVSKNSPGRRNVFPYTSSAGVQPQSSLIVERMEVHLANPDSVVVLSVMLSAVDEIVQHDRSLGMISGCAMRPSA